MLHNHAILKNVSKNSNQHRTNSTPCHEGKRELVEEKHRVEDFNGSTKSNYKANWVP